MQAESSQRVTNGMNLLTPHCVPKGRLVHTPKTVTSGG
jgi:hypothetical protein